MENNKVMITAVWLAVLGGIGHSPRRTNTP